MESTVQLVEPDSPPPKPTLHSLLMALSQADDQMQQIDFDKEIDLIEQGKVKVDNYKYIIDKLEAQEIMLEKRLKEYNDAKRVVANHRDRLAKHLLFALQSNGFEKFTGHQYVVAVRRASPAVEVNAGEPSAAMKIKYDQYIRTRYEWDKVALRDGLKAGDSTAAELASLRDSFYPKFSILKDV